MQPWREQRPTGSGSQGGSSPNGRLLRKRFPFTATGLSLAGAKSVAFPSPKAQRDWTRSIRYLGCGAVVTFSLFQRAVSW